MELATVQPFHGWLEDQQQCWQACRVIGDSRTGKTIACDAYRLNHARQTASGDAPIMPHQAIGDPLGVRVKWVEDWELPSKQRNPTELQFTALSKLVEVEPKQVAKTLPSDRRHVQTRLCAVCDIETRVDQAVWQRLGKPECDCHAPALWEDEHCEGYGLVFVQMQWSGADLQGWAIDPINRLVR